MAVSKLQSRATQGASAPIGGVRIRPGTVAEERARLGAAPDLLAGREAKEAAAGERE